MQIESETENYSFTYKMKSFLSRNRYAVQHLFRYNTKFLRETRERNNLAPSLKDPEKWQFEGFRCRWLCQSVEKSGEARSIDLPVTRPVTVIQYMDTLAVCKRLTECGFKKEEAEALTEVLTDVISAVVDYQTKLTVTKPQQEIMVQQLLSQIASVKKDMVILEKSEFTMIRNDTEKQGILIKHLEGQLEDGIRKLEGQVRLDINLEKSRAVEAHALNEKQLQNIMNKLDVQHAQNEKNLKALDNKIDVEVSNLRTQNEKNRNDVQKYLMGLVLSGATLFLAYLRLIA